MILRQGKRVDVPVDWGGNAVLVTSLQAVKHTKNLSSVTASASRIAENETNSLLRVNDEDRANGESNALAVNIGSVLVVDPNRIRSDESQMARFAKTLVTHMSYASATLRSLSPMMGNLRLLPEISLMSLIQPSCESTVFAERPMSLAPRRVNSGSSFAKAPSSVVHTGV